MSPSSKPTGRKPTTPKAKPGAKEQKPPAKRPLGKRSAVKDAHDRYANLEVG